MKLYGYQLSQATMRIRIALNLKKIKFEEEYIDLLKGAQFTTEFKRLNPQQVVPTIVMNDQKSVLFQSMAILEYLEEAYPQPALLPSDIWSRARVRGLCQIIIADTHRSSVPSVRNYITDTLDQSEETLNKWIHHWISKGLEAFESILRSSNETGMFCHGDNPTLADLCLFPQVMGAKRFNVSLDAYPISMDIFNRCMEVDAFKNAIPN